MKKSLFLLIFIMLCAFNADFAIAKDTSNKVVVESLCNFSFDEHTNNIQLKVVQENEFKNSIKFEEGSILTAKISKVINPKRGKRDGYFIIDPILYTIPSTGEIKDISGDTWLAKVLGYKPFDAKNAAVGAGLTVAGHFVKGIGQFYYFGQGIVHPEDGENRLKSGVKNVYENSPLAYIEEGKEASVEKGDMLLLKFYYNDVPKWKFWKRNQ